MRLFLVREAGTTKVHGIFWAQTPAGLRHAVEEMAAPDRFEWAEVTRLGGVWRMDPWEAREVPDPRDFPVSSAGERAFGRAFDRAFDFGFDGFGERLVEMVADQGAHSWTRFDRARPERAPRVPALQGSRSA